MTIKTSISRVLITRIVLLSSFITLAFTVFQVWRSYEEDLGVIRMGLQRVETTVLPTMAHELWVNDLKTVKFVLQGIATLHYVAKAEIMLTEHDNQIFSHGTEAAQPFVRVIPIKYKDYRDQIRHLGELRITAELDGIYQNLWKRSFFILGVNFLQILIVAAFMMLLFERSVVRHLRVLAEALHEFNPEQESKEIKFPQMRSRQDELSVLAWSFNVMAQSMRRSWLSLREADKRLQALHIELSKQSERQKLFLDSMPQHLAILDAKGDIIYVNHAWITFAKANGYEGETYGLGVNYLEVCEQDPGCKTIVRNLEALIGGWSHDFIMEYPLHTSDNEYWFTLRMNRCESHGEIYLIVTHTNMTRQKRAEQKLQKTNDLLRKTLREQDNAFREIAAIVETVPDVILTTDHLGTIEFANNRTELIFGYKPEELISRNVNMLMTSPHREEHHRYIKQYHQTGEPRIIGTTRELPAKRKDGSIFFIELSVGEFYIDDEQKFTGFIRDVSKRKFRHAYIEDLNEELRRTNARLEERVLERTEKLQQAHQTMVQQERLVSLGTLVAGVAHEMKNPLSFIINFAKLTKRDLEDLLIELKSEPLDFEEVDELTKGIQQYCQKMVEHGERASNIVTTMLSHSRSERGQTWTQVDVNALLQEYFKIAHHAFRAQHTGFEIKQCLELNEKIPHIWGAAPRLGQVFLNIINNALEALANQQDQESVFQPQLKIRTEFHEKVLTVTITDNGPGMPESVKKQIFDPFFTTKDPGKGTGLGLSLSHTIIADEHKGKLSVKSKEGQGTTFFISIPLGKEK